MVIGNAQIIFTNEGDDGCFIDNASNLSGSIALWLPGLDGIGSDYVFGPDGGDLSVDPVNGELVLSGEVYNTENPNLCPMQTIHPMCALRPNECSSSS